MNNDRKFWYLFFHIYFVVYINSLSIALIIFYLTLTLFHFLSFFPNFIKLFPVNRYIKFLRDISPQNSLLSNMVWDYAEHLRRVIRERLRMKGKRKHKSINLSRSILLLFLFSLSYLYHHRIIIFIIMIIIIITITITKATQYTLFLKL